MRFALTIPQDNGGEFVNWSVQGVIAANGCRHIRCRPYNPCAEGKVERQVQNTARYISVFSDKFTKPWCHLLQRCADYNNTSSHKLTKSLPLEMCTGHRYERHPDTGTPKRGGQIESYTYAAMYHSANAYRARYSCKILEENLDNRKTHSIKVGDSVLARHPKTRRGFEKRPLDEATVMAVHTCSVTSSIKFDLKWNKAGGVSKVNSSDVQMNASHDPTISAQLDVYGAIVKRVIDKEEMTPKKGAKATHDSTPQRALQQQHIPPPNAPHGFRFSGVSQKKFALFDPVLIWWQNKEDYESSSWYFARVVAINDSTTAPVILRVVADDTTVADYPCNKEREGALRGEWSWMRLSRSAQVQAKV